MPLKSFFGSLCSRKETPRTPDNKRSFSGRPHHQRPVGGVCNGAHWTLTPTTLTNRMLVLFPGYPLPALVPVMVPGFLLRHGRRMVDHFLSEIASAVSNARLEAYRPAGASDMDTVVNYFRNIELSEALYPSLQAFEIALRNSVHGALRRHFHTEFWFDSPDLLLKWQREAVQRARDELTKNQKPHDANRIVTELNFGFWHSLFNSPYENALWHANGAVLLQDVFPNLPRSNRTRRVVWNRIDQIRRLRDRVFHYEPIWQRPLLVIEHAQIIEALGWLNAEMRRAIELYDRFELISTASQGAFDQKLYKYCGTL